MKKAGRKYRHITNEIYFAPDSMQSHNKYNNCDPQTKREHLGMLVQN